MADGQLRGGLLPVRHHAQRDLSAVARLYVEAVEHRGIGLEVLSHLHHHVVLVELGEDGGDLALAEGVVERVVHVGHGDSQPRRSVAVDQQLGAQALILEVAGHVGNHFFVAECVHHLVRVSSQFDRVRIFEGVLKLGAADAIFDRKVLKRLQEELNAFHAGQLGLQAANHLGGGDFAFIERLQIDLDAARVECGVGSVHADERGDVIHGWILQQHLHKLLLALGHGGEADRLRRLADAQDHARILHREEALGDHHIEQQGGHQRADSDHQRDEAIAQNHCQRPSIRVDDGVEDLLRPIVEARLLGDRFVLKNARAHHRRQRQRDHGGDQDGNRQGDGELAEEPAHHVAHKQERNQHRDERNGQRHDGEADLFAALERRLHRAQALFNKSRNVLDHHDGVVHHKTGGDGERHQCQIVERVAQQVHYAEGAHNRQRHRDRGNDGSRQIAQKKEDDHHHQCDGQHQLVFHVTD